MAKTVLFRCGGGRVVRAAAFWFAVLAGSAGAAAAVPPVTPPMPTGQPELREIRRADGGLSHCVVDQAYANGMHVNIARNPDGQMNLGIVVPGAAFGVSEVYPVRLELAGAPMRLTKARALTAEMLLIDLGRDTEFIPQLVEVQRLAVVGRVDRMDFAVPAAAAMQTQLEQCSAQHDKILPPALQELLQAAGLGDSVVLDLDATPDGHAFADYAWRRGAVTGGARQRDPGRAADFPGIVKAQLAALKDHCRGLWHQAVSDVASFGPARQQRALLTCRRAGEGNVMSVLFHQAADGRFSIISHAGALAEKENVRAATAQLGKVLAAGAAAK